MNSLSPYQRCHYPHFTGAETEASDDTAGLGSIAVSERAEMKIKSILGPGR